MNLHLLSSILALMLCVSANANVIISGNATLTGTVTVQTTNWVASGGGGCTATNVIAIADNDSYPISGNLYAQKVFNPCAGTLTSITNRVTVGVGDTYHIEVWSTSDNSGTKYGQTVESDAGDGNLHYIGLACSISVPASDHFLHIVSSGGTLSFSVFIISGGTSYKDTNYALYRNGLVFDGGNDDLAFSEVFQ